MEFMLIFKPLQTHHYYTLKFSIIFLSTPKPIHISIHIQIYDKINSLKYYRQNKCIGKYYIFNLSTAFHKVLLTMS